MIETPHGSQSDSLLDTPSLPIWSEVARWAKRFGILMGLLFLVKVVRGGIQYYRGYLNSFKLPDAGPSSEDLEMTIFYATPFAVLGFLIYLFGKRFRKAADSDRVEYMAQAFQLMRATLIFAIISGFFALMVLFIDWFFASMSMGMWMNRQVH